jgi:hypothetical protein
MDDLLNAFEHGLTGEHMHTRWMRLALEEARMAAAEDEVPVGAIVVAARARCSNPLISNAPAATRIRIRLA